MPSIQRPIAKLVLTGLLGGLLVGCSQEPGPLSEPRPKEVTARQAAITAQQTVQAAQNGLTFVLSDSYSWVAAQSCAACHRGGLPLFSSALSVKNGLTVNRGQLDWLANFEAWEQTRWGDNWYNHDGTSANGCAVRLSKGPYEFWALSGYNSYSGNSQYQNQLRSGIDWLRNAVINQAYSTGNSTCAGWNWPSQYIGGGWRLQFPNDGKAYAGQVSYFVPNDYESYPTVVKWTQATGLVVSGISLWLNSNQALTAADRTTYTNFRDSLANSLEGTYARSAGSYYLSDLYYSLMGLIAAGRTPANNANVAALRDEILSRKPAGVTGWSDPSIGFGSASPASTGQALYALCQAGVRLDQNQAVNDAINWLVTNQNGSGYWSYPGYTVDIPTSYAVLGLSCYGVLNINVAASNVSPADPNNAGAAQVSPGIAGSQSVTFNLNVQNQGYVTNSFTFSASGGVPGTTFSFNPATLTVAANATGTTQVTATFPANLQAGISVPVSVVTTYVAAGGTSSTTTGVTVNVGTVANPGAGALVTTPSWVAGNGASVQVGGTLTLTAKVLQGANTVSAGSMTFFVGGQAIGTVAASGGQFSISWPVPNNITGNAAIQANYSGGVSGATSYAASSVSGTVTITLPPPPPAPSITGPANNYTSTNGNVSVTGSSQAGAIITVKSGSGANLGTITVPAGGAYSVPLNLAPGVYTITAVATNAGGNSPPSTTQTIIINPQPPVISAPMNGSSGSATTVAVSGTGYAVANVAAELLGDPDVMPVVLYSSSGADPNPASFTTSADVPPGGGATSRQVKSGTVLNGGGTLGGVMHNIPTASMSPSHSYQLSYWAKSLSGPQSIHFSNQSGGGDENALSHSQSLTTSWVRYTRTVLLTGNGNNAPKPNLYIWGEQPNQTFLLDGMILQEVASITTINVTEAGAAVGTLYVDAAGNWSGSLSLSLGAHALSFTQTVGGATSAPAALNIGIVPPAPTLASPANNAALPNGNNVFTGSATPGTTVSILDNGVSIGTGVAAANGQYNITAPLGYGTHTITVITSNAAGPSAASAAITVKVAPGAPVITTPAVAAIDLTGPITFAGTGVAGATVTIYDNGVQINQQVIAANGSFSYTIAAPTLGGHSLTATQTSNGQTSPASAARVVTVHNDSDGDTVYDEVDNCSNIWNKDQVDRDGDGLGDVCDQAPGQKDSTNQSTSNTDLGVTSLADAGSDDTLLARNQNNLVTLPAGAWGTRNTLTLVVDTAANPTGNIQLFGKPLPSAPTWTLMTTYDLQLGPTHPVTLANGLQAQVNVVTPRTSLANYAFRYRQVQARVKEADGSITTIPSCNTGTVSANDPRCVSVSNAYQIVEGTNVDQGVKFTFTMKSL